MKKSEKLKGKVAVANRKKQYLQYVIAGAAALIVIAAIGFYLFNPSVAKKGDTVMVYYTGSYENGTEFESHMSGDPLIFTLGNGTVVAGFEEAIIGMDVNATKTVHVPVEKAYGPHLDRLVHIVNRSTLSKDIEPVIGNRYIITRNADGAVSHILITNVTNDTITIDENHQLAGQNLTFTIRFAGFYRK